MNQSFSKLVFCAAALLALGSCSGGGSDGGGTTTPPPPAAGSVTISGTVSGTVIKILNADTNALISQFDTATLNQAPPFLFTFTLNNVLGTPARMFFITGGAVYPLYYGTPPNGPSNVFTLRTAGTVELGAVITANGQAIPTAPTGSAVVELGLPNPTIPQIVIPPPPTVTVAIPANNASVPSGPVDITFVAQHVTIGDQNHDHLHFFLDPDQSPYEFVNESMAGQIRHNGSPAVNAQWISSTKFRLLNLSSGQHTVNFELATASHIPFVNQEAGTSVQFTVDQPPPNPPATVSITSPSNSQMFLFGPVSVTFAVSDFTVQGQGQPQLHFYLDLDPNVYQFFNGPTNQVRYNGAPTTSVVPGIIPNTFQFQSLTEGTHSVRLVLANGDGVVTELANAEATAVVTFTVNPPSGNSPTLTINSPGAQLPPGPVLITFNIQSSPVAPSATQPRMHFYVDNDTTVYKFYDGPGVGEDGSTSGVRYKGFHTHFVHWKSSSSIQLNSLASGLHQVRFVLVDQFETELTGTQKTLDFTILPGTAGEFSLQLLVQGDLSFPAAMATTPDGRIFVNELTTGKIRVVTPKATPTPWVLQNAPFAILPVEITGPEQGLLGIAVDPQFITNGFVYVFYTAAGPVNRIVRFKATVSNGNTVATSANPTVILDDIPAGETHNSGIIHFGPDGMLYIAVGENEINPDAAQQLTTRKGKILRIKPDGTIPSDNPFQNSPIYSLGHRNSFGFTFHPHTGDLWQTENGPNDNDEINRIIRGGNYGWPIVSGIGNNPLYIDPIITFTPTIAPTGIVAIREDSAYPAQYHNNLLFADFNIGQLHRIVLGGPGLTDFVSHSISCDCGWGGLIAVMHGLNVPGQDGYVYVSNGAGIFRVVLN